jgi:hypothetical protein
MSPERTFLPLPNSRRSDYGSESDKASAHDETNRLPSSTSPPSEPFIFPKTIPNYCKAATTLETALREGSLDARAVDELLHQVSLSLPFHPTPQIIIGEPLYWRFPLLRVDMHLNATLEDALDNIGTPVSDSEKFLKYIIQHPWGWSATPKQHRNANGCYVATLVGRWLDVGWTLVGRWLDVGTLVGRWSDVGTLV